jgi:histidinol-phosphate aminotransferase
LAGARFGSLLANAELVQWILAILAPYPLSIATITAVLETLAPNNLIQLHKQRDIIRQEREKFLAVLPSINSIIKVWPTEANFILFQALNGPKLMEKCLKQGIVLRSMHDKPGLENCIRISIGKPEENQRLIEVLKQTF